MNPKHTLLAMAVLLSAAAAPAQTIVGISSSPAALAASVQQQPICSTSTPCPSPHAAPTVAHAGGAAYSSHNASIWTSTGDLIVEQALDDCRTLCRLQPQFVLGPASVVSGLAVSQRRMEMYVLETDPAQMLAAITTYSIRPCPPVFVSACRIPLDRGMAAAGLAYDERRDLIFFSASDFTGPTPNNTIFAARRADMCNPFCKVPLVACSPTAPGPMGPLTGLGYYGCRELLFATDGRQTAMLQVALTPTGCPERLTGCCDFLSLTRGEVLHGIDVRFPGTSDTGRSCLEPGCPACTSMRLAASGDPAVGNPVFALSIQDGPAGAVGFLALGVGGCTPGIPVACGLFHPALAPIFPIFLGPLALTGTGCDGEARFNLPVPLDWSFCGASLCAQGVVVCPRTLDLGLTNAVQLTLGL